MNAIKLLGAVKMKKVLFALVLIPLLFIGCSKKGEEVAGDNGQTFLKVKVLEDNVALRYHPKENSSCGEQKLNKGDVVYVAGLDRAESVVDGKKGYWVQVFPEKEFLLYAYWVFSSEIDAGKSLSPNGISFESESIKDNNRITVAIKDGAKKITRHDVDVQSVADFYSFTWGPWDEGFNYCDPVGTFIFNPSEKSVERFSSVGDVLVVTGWTKPSPDLKYVLSDSGTSVTGRWIDVYDAVSEENVFGANYYMDVEYSDGKITWTKNPVYGLNVENSDKEVADFIANTPVPDELKDYPNNLVVRKFYEHNLATNEDRFIGCRYTFEE